MNGVVEDPLATSLPSSPLPSPLPWLAADLMGLAAVEEKQRGLVAYAVVRTKSRTHTHTHTVAWSQP